MIAFTWTAVVAASCGGGSALPSGPAEVGVVIPPAPTASASAEPAEDPGAKAVPPEEITAASWPLPAAVVEGSNAAQKACLAALAKEEKADARNTSKGPLVNDDPFRGCFASKSGAWGIITHVSDYEVIPMLPGLSAQQCQEDDNCPVQPVHEGSLTYFTDKGKAIIGPHMEQRGGGLQEGTLALYDYDGDGIEEVALWSDTGHAYTLRDGKIGVYGPVEKLKFGRIVNADGDAIPDLLLDNPYRQSPSAAWGCGRRWGAPLMILNVEILAVAHGLPNGTFSTTDTEATARVRKVCPVSPVQIVRRDNKGMIDHEATWTNIACARLWGQSETDVRRQLNANCGQLPADEETCERLFDIQEGKVFDHCVGREWTDDWLTEIPPVSIK